MVIVLAKVASPRLSVCLSLVVRHPNFRNLRTGTLFSFCFHSSDERRRMKNSGMANQILTRSLGAQLTQARGHGDISDSPIHWIALPVGKEKRVLWFAYTLPFRVFNCATKARLETREPCSLRLGGGDRDRKAKLLPVRTKLSSSGSQPYLASKSERYPESWRYRIPYKGRTCARVTWLS